ncbi:PH domain-containing protein [Rothia sp. CCM 9418]|uniref:PH domain-containing protein n=1 Tax=Rothia sp. CCM 9418 TaxID=3402661 RepID=UPI003AE76C47
MRVATRMHRYCLLPPMLYFLLSVFCVNFASAISTASFIWSFLGYLLTAVFLYQMFKRLNRYFSTQYFITTHRLIIQRGWRNNRSVSIGFTNIISCAVQGAWLGSTKIGKLMVHTPRGSLVLQRVPRPQAFSEQLNQACQEFNAYNNDGLAPYI